ncbi:hypothetical protein BGZ73_005433 [Actinomortierella ambigua]|nr:hypothetical protein BGZ73_005433 [Actinomortierella ambigua]
MTSSLNSPNTPVPEQAPPLPSANGSAQPQCCSHSDCPTPISAGEADSGSRLPKLNRRKSNGALLPSLANTPPAVPSSPTSPRRCLACARRESLRGVDDPSLASHDGSELLKISAIPTLPVNPRTPHPSLLVSRPGYHPCSDANRSDQHDHTLLEAEHDVTRREEPEGLDVECAHHDLHRHSSSGLQRSTEPDHTVWSRLSTQQQQQQRQQQQRPQMQPQLAQLHAGSVQTNGNHRSDSSNPGHLEKDHTRPKCHPNKENNSNKTFTEAPAVQDHHALRQSHRTALPPPLPPLVLATTATTTSSSSTPKQSMILLPPLSLDVSPSHSPISSPSPTTPTTPRARMTPPTIGKAVASSLAKGQQLPQTPPTTTTTRRSSLSSTSPFSTVRRRTSLDQSSPSMSKMDVTASPSRLPTRRGSVSLLESSKVQHAAMPSPPETKVSSPRRSSNRSSGTWSTSSLSPVNASDTVRLYQPPKPSVGDTTHRRRPRQIPRPCQSIFDNALVPNAQDNDEGSNDEHVKEDDDEEDIPSARPAVDKELLEQVNKISQDKMDAMDKIMGTKRNARFTISRKKGQKILAELEKEFGSDDEEAPAGTKTPTALSHTVKHAVSDDPDATIKLRLTSKARSRPPTLILQYAGSESPKEPALQPILNPEQFVTRRFVQWSTVARLGRKVKKRKAVNPYPPSASSSSSVVSQPDRISPSSSQGSLSSTDQDGNVLIKSLPSDLTSCRAEHAVVSEATTQPSKPTSRHVLSILELFENKGYDRSKNSSSSDLSKGKDVVRSTEDQGINSPAWKMAAKVLFNSSGAPAGGLSTRKKAETGVTDESVQTDTQKTVKDDTTATRGRQGWLTTKKIFQTLTKSSKPKATKASAEEATPRLSESSTTVMESGIESFPPQPPSITIKRFLTSRRKMLSQVLFGPDKTDPSRLEGSETPDLPATQPANNGILGLPVALPNKALSSSASAPAPSSAPVTAAGSGVDAQPGFVSITSLTSVPPPGRRNSLHDLIGGSRSNSGSSNQQQQQQPLLQSAITPTTSPLSSSTMRRNSTQGLMTPKTSPSQQEPSRRHMRVATTNSVLGSVPPCTSSSSSAAGSASKFSSLYQRRDPQSTSASTFRSSDTTAFSNEAHASRRSSSSGSSTPVQSNSRAASPIHKLAMLLSHEKLVSAGSGTVAASNSAPNSPTLGKSEKRHSLSGMFEVPISAALPPRPFIHNATGSMVAEAGSQYQQQQQPHLWSSNRSADMYSRYTSASRNNSLNSRRNSSHTTGTCRAPSDSSLEPKRRYSAHVEGSDPSADQNDSPANRSNSSSSRVRPYDHHTGMDLVNERHDFLMGDNVFYVPGSTTRSIQDLQQEANDVLRHGGLHLELSPPAAVLSAKYADQQQQHQHQQHQHQDSSDRSTRKSSVMTLRIAQHELFSTPPQPPLKDTSCPQPNHATQRGDAKSCTKNNGDDNSTTHSKALQLDLPQTPWLLLATTPERMDLDHGMYRFGGDSQRRRRWPDQPQQQRQQQHHQQQQKQEHERRRRQACADSSNSEADEAEEEDDDDSAEEDDETLEDGHSRFTPGLSSATKSMYFDASWDRIKHGGSGSER